MFVQFFFEDYIYIFNANNISSPRDIIFETICSSSSYITRTRNYTFPGRTDVTCVYTSLMDWSALTVARQLQGLHDIPCIRR